MPKITLPTLHKGQQEAFWLPGRNKVIRCGRRWGKSIMGGVWVADGAAKGLKCGWFAPNYKYLREAWSVVKKILEPIAVKVNESTYTIECIGGGKIDFWTLDDENAGRSREYHRVVLDEVAFAKDKMIDIWKRSIRPTMLTTRGRCLALSTPNGDNPDNFFWQLCNDPAHGFVEYHAPSWNNPFVPPEEIEDLRKTESELVFKQEYAAEFIDWKTESFFKIENFLVDGAPVTVQGKPDYVFAVVDTTMKGGQGNDGTAVVYYAVNKQFGNIPLYILDWDIVEMEGGMLDDWMPSVFQTCEKYARDLGARYGSHGAWVEDKATGTILIQQGQRRGWPIRALDSKLTSLGKDPRAMNASSYVFQGKIKITDYAFNKQTVFKQKGKNHFLTQVIGYRYSDPDAYKREDDLLDCLCYGVAVGLGDMEGI